MKDGFVRVGSVSPKLRVADVTYNIENCIAEAKNAARLGVKVLGYPELAVSGATCADLFRHGELIGACERALERFISETAELDMISFIGVPVRAYGRLYNCAAAVHRGMLLGLVAKAYPSHTSEIFDARQFSPAPDQDICAVYAGQDTVIGGSLIFADQGASGLSIACEIGGGPEFLSHSLGLVGSGVNLVVSMTASAETVGTAHKRRNAVSVITSVIPCACICANSPDGESTTDAVFTAHNIIASCGDILAELQPFSGETLATAVIDTAMIFAERRRADVHSEHVITDLAVVPFCLEQTQTLLTSAPSRTPFIPQDTAQGRESCELALAIQSQALACRMERSHSSSMVIGISGGLDSTLALLVCIKTADRLGIDRRNIIGVTMPCFGTTSRTRSNAEKLADALGITFRTVDIKKSVTQHLKDIGHDGVTADVTYENAQARERTQVLMDIANSAGGLVVGTGDLSELVLGWATYNGDHMSMYAVNSSVPKTLVRHIVAVYAECDSESEELRSVLLDILATPVSPELLPPKDGEIAQCTEDLVGPYELHDYFIYYTLKYGFSPRHIYRLACLSFEGVYDRAVILGWLRVFTRRFFNQQFKRSCMPDGPKIGDISVSPRGGLCMPSDASASVWLAELDTLKAEES